MGKPYSWKQYKYYYLNDSQVPIYTWEESGKCDLMSSQRTLAPDWDLNPQLLDWESSE